MFIISFRSRTSTMAFSRILKQFNIPNSIINTPNGISSSCSLSVQVELDLQTIRTILFRSNIKDYIGVFTYTKRTFIRVL